MRKAFNSRDVIRVLEKDGWYLATVRGSHHNFKHATKPGRTTVPHPQKDMFIATVRSKANQAGLKLSDFQGT